MANDSVGVAAAGTPTNYIDNESISTGGSPATVDRQRVRVGGANYTDLADVVTGDTGQGAQVVVPARKEVSFSSTTVQPVASTDCSNYRFVSVQFTAPGTGAAVDFQGSNDNSHWIDILLVRTSQTSSSASANASGTGLSAGQTWVGPLSHRYFRVNVNSISSGTLSGVVELFANAMPVDVPHVSIENVISTVATTSQCANNGASQADAFANSNGALLPSPVYKYNGATWDRQRVPTIFKTATAAASGDTALWTPTAGKKFRLLRFKIEATADAATSGGAGIDVVLRDATTATAAAMSFYAPATSVTTNPGVISTGWVDLGNGVLSAAANNVLNVNLSAALTSGKVRVVACGTEE